MGLCFLSPLMGVSTSGLMLHISKTPLDALGYPKPDNHGNPFGTADFASAPELTSTSGRCPDLDTIPLKRGLGLRV